MNNMEKNKQYISSDEALIASFFAEHREPITDNGFTERVLSALPQRENASWAEAMRLRRWSLWLNVLGTIAGIGLLIYLGVFTEWMQFLQHLSNRLISGVLYFDYSNLLVQFMLFLHRLRELMPSPTQLLAIALTSMILTAVGIKRVVTDLQ